MFLRIYISYSCQPVKISISYLIMFLISIIILYVNLPEVYLLCGPAGSGKTTYYDKELQAQGVVKLSIDESMQAQFGVAGVNYPVNDYPAHERYVLDDHKNQLVGCLAMGQSVALDYGFWRREEREEYKGFVERHGGRWRLLYFKASREVLRNRLEVRSVRSDANAVPVSATLLDEFLARFEVPDGEGEEVIQQHN